MPSRLPRQLDVTFRTVHSSKGLEADYVVLPNVSSGTYGFPSEVVDDPILALAMTEADDYPHAEERRLFYVALTRARRHVTLIGVQGLESPFVAELLADNRLELSPLSTVDLSEPCPTCGKGVLVVRRRRADGSEFLGCSAFPKCRYTRSVADWRDWRPTIDLPSHKIDAGEVLRVAGYPAGDVSILDPRELRAEAGVPDGALPRSAAAKSSFKTVSRVE